MAKVRYQWIFAFAQCFRSPFIITMLIDGKASASDYYRRNCVFESYSRKVIVWSIQDYHVPLVSIMLKQHYSDTVIRWKDPGWGQSVSMSSPTTSSRIISWLDDVCWSIEEVVINQPMARSVNYYRIGHIVKEVVTKICILLTYQKRASTMVRVFIENSFTITGPTMCESTNKDIIILPHDKESKRTYSVR